ncbi:hypothetical protein DFH07DRAFT_785800 [Mycena maculata]|uniref:JmjC domain-containing protein n=1 Tax=Mycena maculata TaxID=230809 RepID=A0AAD7MFM3_9AGAR|nr:hypothetical protein DFH07DRAFT_785800 [Mycena maculata]
MAAPVIFTPPLTNSPWAQFAPWTRQWLNADWEALTVTFSHLVPAPRLSFELTQFAGLVSQYDSSFMKELPILDSTAPSFRTVLGITKDESIISSNEYSKRMHWFAVPLLVRDMLLRVLNPNGAIPALILIESSNWYDTVTTVGGLEEPPTAKKKIKQPEIQAIFNWAKAHTVNVFGRPRVIANLEAAGRCLGFVLTVQVFAFGKNELKEYVTTTVVPNVSETLNDPTVQQQLTGIFGPTAKLDGGRFWGALLLGLCNGATTFLCKRHEWVQPAAGLVLKPLVCFFALHWYAAGNVRFADHTSPFVKLDTEIWTWVIRLALQFSSDAATTVTPTHQPNPPNIVSWQDQPHASHSEPPESPLMPTRADGEESHAPPKRKEPDHLDTDDEPALKKSEAHVLRGVGPWAMPHSGRSSPTSDPFAIGNHDKEKGAEPQDEAQDDDENTTELVKPNAKGKGKQKAEQEGDDEGEQSNSDEGNKDGEDDEESLDPDQDDNGEDTAKPSEPKPEPRKQLARKAKTRAAKKETPQTTSGTPRHRSKKKNSATKPGPQWPQRVQLPGTYAEQQQLRLGPCRLELEQNCPRAPSDQTVHFRVCDPFNKEEYDEVYFRGFESSYRTNHPTLTTMVERQRTHNGHFPLFLPDASNPNRLLRPDDALVSALHKSTLEDFNALTEEAQQDIFRYRNILLDDLGLRTPGDANYVRFGCLADLLRTDVRGGEPVLNFLNNTLPSRSLSLPPGWNALATHKTALTFLDGFPDITDKKVPMEEFNWSIFAIKGANTHMHMDVAATYFACMTGVKVFALAVRRRFPLQIKDEPHGRIDNRRALEGWHSMSANEDVWEYKFFALHPVISWQFGQA